MKGIFGTAIRNVHWLILFWTAFDVWSHFEKHQLEMNQINQKIQLQRNSIKKAREQADLLKSFQENLEASKQRVEEVAQQIESVQKQLPNSISDTEILDSFMNEATSINVRDIFLTPKEESDRGFYYAKDYEVKGTGTYLQFMIFFERLSSLDRILNVRKLSISSASGKRKGRFQMVSMETTIEAYRYNAAYREDRGIKEIESQFKKSGKRPSKNRKGKRKGT